MNVIHRMVRDFVLATNKYAMFSHFNRLLYDFAIKLAVGHFKSIPGLTSIYVGGSMASGRITPGLSDIDLDLIGEWDKADDELAFIQETWKRSHNLKRFFPFFNHIDIHTSDEINLFKANGFPFHIDSSNEDRLLWGQNILKGHNGSYPGWRDLEVFAGGLTQYSRAFTNSFMNHELGLNDKLFLLYLSKAFTGILRGGLGSNPLNGMRFPRDAALRHYLDWADSPSTKNLLRNFVIGKGINFESALSSYVHVIRFLDEICGSGRDRFLRQDMRRTFSSTPSECCFPLETLDVVVDSVSPLACDIFSATEGRVRNITLGSISPRNYDYVFYVVLEDDLEDEELRDVILETRSCFRRHRDSLNTHYFSSFKYPILVTSNMLSVDYLFYKGPFEHFYLRKHQTVLAGKSLIDGVPAPCDSITYRLVTNGCQSISESRLKSGLLFDNRANVEFLTYLVDLVSGIIPASKLALEKQVVVCTPREALAEYNRLFDDDYADFLNSFYGEYVGKTPKELGELDAEELLKDCFPHIHRFNKETVSVLSALIL